MENGVYVSVCVEHYDRGRDLGDGGVGTQRKASVWVLWYGRPTRAFVWI